MPIIKKISRLFIYTLLLLLSACAEDNNPLTLFERGDYQKAYQLWLPLAEAGDAEAQNYLGICHFLGLGVAKDYQQSLKWYQLAAEQSHVAAQRNYADMIYYGMGTQKDIGKAFKWYFAASQQGNAKATAKIATISGAGNLSPNHQVCSKLSANQFIADKTKRFTNYDKYTYSFCNRIDR